MKLRIWSDVHLEFGELVWTKHEDDKNTVLVIAGDLFVWKQKEEGQRLLRELCDNFKAVVYVCGNHEFYHSEISEVINGQYQFALEIPNLFFLQDDYCVIDGVRFVGSTLWTDLNNADDIVMQQARMCMNDYRKIRYYDVNDDRERELRPSDVIAMNDKTRDVLAKNLFNLYDNKTVIVTHHLPDVKYVNGYADGLLQYAYGNTLMDTYFGASNLVMWIHGHAHIRQEYEINGVKVVANPRGYIGHQHIAYTFQDDKVWEI
jgi:metallophosphoesterase superfamily enzyme